MKYVCLYSCYRGLILSNKKSYFSFMKVYFFLILEEQKKKKTAITFSLPSITIELVIIFIKDTAMVIHFENTFVAN